MQRAVIISGGNIDEDLALRFLSRKPEDYSISEGSGIPQSSCEKPYVIAADRGLMFLEAHSLSADLIVGDFDSSPPGLIEKYRSDHPGAQIRRYQPEKDYTDTEIAVTAALEMGRKEIIILGGTGSRIDHVLGNLQLLELIADRGGTGIIVDKHNRITLHRESFAINRDSQWGKYISFFAWGGKVKGLSLKGFHYGLDHYELGTSGSLGVSNELDAKTGIVEFTEGQLLMVESAD